MVLGAPGTGKSATSLAWALRTQLPATCISLDTDLRTQAARVCAVKAGVPVTEVFRDPGLWANYLRYHPHLVRFLDRPLTADQVEEVLVAHTEYFGESPHICVVDNVGNLSMDARGDNEYGAFRKAFSALHAAGRRFETTMLALHHVKRGEASSGTKVPRLSEGIFTGEQQAEIVLGLARPQRDVLRVAVLKNRWGVAHPDGSLYVDLPVDLARMRIGA